MTDKAKRRITIGLLVLPLAVCGSYLGGGAGLWLYEFNRGNVEIGEDFGVGFLVGGLLAARYCAPAAVLLCAFAVLRAGRLFVALLCGLMSGVLVGLLMIFVCFLLAPDGIRGHATLLIAGAVCFGSVLAIGLRSARNAQDRAAEATPDGGSHG